MFSISQGLAPGLQFSLLPEKRCKMNSHNKQGAATALGLGGKRFAFTGFDDQYIQRLRDGDDSVERHFTAYFGHVLPIKLRARLRSCPSVDDLSQETLTRVLGAIRRKGGIEKPERLGAFVSTVCKNVMCEFLRSQRRLATFDASLVEPLDARPNVESELVTRAGRQEVRNVLVELPARDRELLWLVFFEERDTTEVCRKLGLTPNYLRVRLHRAKQNFKTRLLRRRSEWSCRRPWREGPLEASTGAGRAWSALGVLAG